MSQENVEVVRRITDHMNAAGEPGPMESFDPKMTFTTRGDVGSPQTFHGREGLREAMGDFREAWADIRSNLVEVT